MVTVNIGDKIVRNGQAAVASVRCGWHVLPWMMETGRKVPQIRAWQAGSAFTNEDDVRAWWGTNFNHIPGIVCGERSGLWVLDVDPRNGGDKAIAALIAMYGPLPADTFMVTTPGGGWHYYFAWNTEMTGLRKHAMHGHAGLDVIAEGGWVAAPNAWSAAGAYQQVADGTELRAAPGWLISLVFAGNPSIVTDSNDHSAVLGTHGWDEWLNGEIRRVGEIGQGGQRSALLRFTGALRTRGYAREVAEEASLMAMRTMSVDPLKGPWSDVDVIEMLAGAWAKYAPADVSWATDAVAALVAELPVPVESFPPPIVVILGEAPEIIGPDDENAQELIAFAQDKLLWMSGGDWYAWDGKRWRWDKAQVRKVIIREMGLALVQQAGEAGLNEDERRRLIARYTRLGTVAGRDACLSYAQPFFAVDADRLDADPWQLNTHSGLVDLRTGEVRRSVPADLVSRLADTEWLVGARDETWERMLSEMIPDLGDRAWIQRWAGYCLTGLTTEKAILMMHGLADSGKSTVTSPFQYAMGDYAVTWKPSMLVAGRDNNVDAELFRAMGARLVAVSEFPRAGRLDESVLKMATATDRVTARALYQASVEYVPQFKLWIHTNHLPGADEEALMKRMRFFRMGQALRIEQRDERIKTWLESSGPRAAIMWWAWQGLREMLRLGGLGKPVGSDVAAVEHQLASDPLRRFMDDICVATGDVADVISWDYLVMAYNAWCMSEQVKAIGSGVLKARLSERGMEKVRVRDGVGGRGQAVVGWRLVTSTESSQGVSIYGL